MTNLPSLNRNRNRQNEGEAMRYSLIATLLITMPCWSQTTTTGQAQATGPCSPAVSGNNNQFTINCQGITKEQGAEFLKILNKISRDQLDPKAVLNKLNDIEKEVQGVAKSIPRSRVLDKEHANKFSAAFQGGGNSVYLFADGTDADVIPLTTQLCNLFNAAKWSANCVGIPNGSEASVVLPADLIGLHCYNTEYEVRKAFHDSGLTCVYENGVFNDHHHISIGLGAVILIGNAGAR
jgi:hypothetical protein